MKKIITLLLSFVLIFSLSSCQSNSKEELPNYSFPYQNTTEREPEIVVANNLGYAFNLNFVEITIESAGYSKCVYATNNNTCFKASGDEKFWYVTGTLKNTGTKGYDANEIVAEMCFNDKYIYSAYAIVDSGDTITNNFVEPLCTVRYYIYASIPDEMFNIFSSCKVKFGFEENFSDTFFVDFDECDYLYEITVNK